MQRKIIFITSGILFVLISAGLIVIGTETDYKFGIVLYGMAVPFLLVGFWNLFSVVYERKYAMSNDYYTFKRSGDLSFGVGAFYNKDIVVPVFLILFGCAALAIATGFLVNSADEVALALVGVSIVYGLTVTIIFLVKLNRKTAGPIESDEKKTDDEFAFRIAFFFASLATLGLFALGYYLYKKIRK